MICFSTLTGGEERGRCWRDLITLPTGKKKQKKTKNKKTQRKRP